MSGQYSQISHGNISKAIKRAIKFAGVFFGFLVLKKGETTSRVINIPLEMPKTPVKTLSNKCVGEPRC